MGPEFFQTRMGQRFYEVTAPRIADELARLNDQLAEFLAVLRDLAGAAPTAGQQRSGDDAVSSD